MIKDKKAEIGIAVILDAQDTVTVNNDDRYPLMSVFKFHQALAVADYLDRNGLTPDTEIFIPEEELVPDTYSPLRKEFPEGEISLSVSRLLEYSLQLSDNNACDILFEHTGGPAATDRYVRSLGLRNFAIAATEQQMHDDPQTCYENWSTPLEAAALLELLVTEQILTPTLREMIRQNLINCKTGADRLPKPLSGTGAVIGHKTGTSDRDERGIFAGTNDPGFVILPDGTRYTIAVFIKDSAENPETNARIIADISETVYRYVHDEYRENDIRPGKNTSIKEPELDSNPIILLNLERKQRNLHCSCTESEKLQYPKHEKNSGLPHSRPRLLCSRYLGKFFQASSIAEWYPTLTKPTLTPPNIVFPIAWSVLYLCMGLSLGRLIVRRQHKGIIRLWVLQLIANFLWSILFFTLRNPLAGFIDIVLLNILVGLYIFAASRRDRAAAWLFVPYLLWTLFAAYLNGYILLHGTPAAAPTTIQTESLTISKPKTERIMVHKMPELPYSTEALAPKMSKETFEYHYGKHLQTYVDNLNRLIPGTPYESMSLQEIVKKADGPIFNNAAQAWNHTFFFLMLTPDQKPMPQKLADRIARDFGSVEAFKEEFSKAATGLFGSGWTWLAADKDGKLQIISESNAGNPMTKGLKPVMTIDVWEHAYYIDYRNRRADFIKSYWELIDWDKVADRIFPRKYHCTACDYVYDPAKGDPESGIAPGTAFEDIPDDWVCPVCGLYKDSFKIVEEK